MQDDEAPGYPSSYGEKMKGARSRTVDDKYWQIRAKAGEIPSNHGFLHSRLRIITI
jgi:hypothetical protein